MLIKSLKYKNFRQFKGENKIDLSCDKDNNVTIILGNNTFGKTTLLQMFNWCLYNKVMFRRQDNPDMLLNLDVAMNMYNGDLDQVMVEIVLQHQNTEYTITRKQAYKKIEGKVTGLMPMLTMSAKNLSTGGTDPVEKDDSRKEIINKIMPQELSGYFLFDTERVQNVAERKDLSEAVKGLLGLNAMGNARKHLGKVESKTTVIGGFYNDLGTHLGTEKEQRYIKEVQRAEEEITKYEEVKNNTEDEMKKYQQIKEELEDKIRSLADATKLQKEKEQLEQRRILNDNELESECDAYVKLFSDRFVFFMAQPLYKKAKEVLEDADIEDKGIRDITADSIKEIIKNGRCICGTKVENGNEAYIHLMEQLKYVPPESIGTTVANFKKEINLFNRQNRDDGFYMSLQSKIKRMIDITERINEANDRVEQIEKEIAGKEDAGKYQFRLNETKIKLKDLAEKRDNCISIISKNKEQRDHAKKIINISVARNEKNKEINRYMAYAEAIKEWFDDYYISEEMQIREKLENKVNEIFSRMYSGTRVLKIDDKYRTTLYTKAEGSDELVTSGESEGLIRVKNFAFIAGLVDLAKEQKIQIGDKEMKGESYPLILDAPFSNADEIHIKNIARELPGVAEQVIMFVMEKDWRYAKEVIEGKVAKSYVLEKHSDTYSEIIKEYTKCQITE